MLSLLVTADQRCPAIIGQAHLLYHADAERCRFDPAEAVAQLKCDAEDLFKAIVTAGSGAAHDIARPCTMKSLFSAPSMTAPQALQTYSD
jgi:hypothetical protein